MYQDTVMYMSYRTELYWFYCSLSRSWGHSLCRCLLTKSWWWLSKKILESFSMTQKFNIDAKALNNKTPKHIKVSAQTTNWKCPLENKQGSLCRGLAEVTLLISGRPAAPGVFGERCIEHTDCIVFFPICNFLRLFSSKKRERANRREWKVENVERA